MMFLCARVGPSILLLRMLPTFSLCTAGTPPSTHTTSGTHAQAQTMIIINEGVERGGRGGVGGTEMGGGRGSVGGGVGLRW